MFPLMRARTPRRDLVRFTALIGLAALAGCSSSDSSNSGPEATGGEHTAGNANGGALSEGGHTSSGGTSSGGKSSTGGTLTRGGSGGSTASATGGQSSSGGSRCAGAAAGSAYPVIEDSPYSSAYRIRVFGEITFMGTAYRVVNAFPLEYLLSHVQGKKTFNVEETEDYYVVNSQFELPYIPCVMDEVAWTPGPKNKGWASDLNTDPKEAITKNGAGRPFLYHVVADNEYGYATYTEALPDDPIRYSGFRPTWVVHPDGASYQMFYLDPANPNRYGFDWPRHGNGWELNFGLFMDPNGTVYVPKKAPLAIPQWDSYLECVVINQADAPIATVRTQFPGNESYYASETFIPGYAAPPSVGHRYWGQKGRPMSEVAVWESDGGPGLNSPGNYHKPFSGGCDVKGYNFAHAEGFTWPELRAYRTSIGDTPTRAQLYSITMYKLAKDGTATLLGTLSYEQASNGEWIPTASGPEAHSLNDKNGRYIINGPIFTDRGERAVAVLKNLE